MGRAALVNPFNLIFETPRTIDGGTGRAPFNACLLKLQFRRHRLSRYHSVEQRNPRMATYRHVRAAGQMQCL